MNRSNSSVGRSYVKPRECEYTEVDPNVNWFNHFIERGWTVVNEKSFNQSISRLPSINPIRVNNDKLLRDVRDWISVFGPLSDSGLHELTPIEGDYWTSWDQSDVPGSNPSGHVMINSGHTGFMWTARQTIKPVFDYIWDPKNDEFLVTSFEGFSYIIRAPDEPKTFFNLDHPGSINYPICVRGFLSLTESTSDEHGGFLLVDTSAKWFSEYEGQQLPDRRGSIPIDQLWSNPDTKNLFKRIYLKPGDILLMDSRTIYTTYAPLSAEHPFCTLNITMMLSTGLTPADIDQRIQWFSLRKQTSPWCYGSNAVLSNGVNTIPFSTTDRDDHNVLYKNGESISKTVFSDEDCKLVAGMTESEIKKRYDSILKNGTIARGAPPSRSSTKSNRSNRGKSRPSKK